MLVNKKLEAEREPIFFGSTILKPSMDLSEKLYQNQSSPGD